MKSNRTFYIYCITNTSNGKQYIGQTCQDPKLRFRQHKNLASKPLDTRRSYLHNSIRTHGIENFDFDIITTCGSSKEADILEVEYMDVLDTVHPNGYNIRKGGQNNHPNHRNKVAIETVFGGVTYPSISAAAKANGMSFAKFTSFLNGTTNEQKFAVEVDGVWYNSITDASEKLGMSKSCLYSYMKGAKPLKTKVTLNGVVYDSKTEAAKVLGVSKPTLEKILRDEPIFKPKEVSFRGVTYKSASDACRALGVHHNTLYKMIEQDRDKKPCKKSVEILGILYSSVAEAKRLTGFSYEKIHRLLSGKPLIDTSCVIGGIRYVSKQDAMTKLNKTLRQINRLLQPASRDYNKSVPV